MKKKKQSMVYDIVKSMNKKEKARFKQYLKSKGDKDGEAVYLKLYNIFNKMNNYDSKEVMKKLGKQTDFNSVKNYLVVAIFNSIRQTNHLETDVHGKAHAYLEEINWLCKKCLFEIAYRRIKKAKAHIYKFEIFESLLPVLERENQLFVLLKKDVRKTELPQSFKEQYHVLNIINNKQQYWQLHFQLNQIVQKKLEARSVEDEKQINIIMENPLLQDRRKALSKTAEILWMRCWLIYYLYNNQQENKLKMDEQIIDFFQKNPPLIKAAPESYALALASVSGIYALKKDDETFENFLNKRNQLYKKSVLYIKSRLFFTNFSVIGRYIIKSDEGSKNRETGFKELRRIKQEFKDLKNVLSVSETLLYHINMGLAYYILKLYDHSFNSMNTIIDMNVKEVRPEITYWARVFTLLLYACTKNWKMIESNADTIYKFMKRNDESYGMEILIVLGMKRIATEKLSALNTFYQIEKLKQEMETLNNSDSYNSRSPLIPYFYAWLNSELDKRPVNSPSVLEKSEI